MDKTQARKTNEHIMDFAGFCRPLHSSPFTKETTSKIKRGSHKKTERFFRAPPFFMQFFRIRYISLLFRFYRVTT